MKVPTLVLDTGAFIKGFNVWEQGEELCTVDEVILELKDKRGKERLAAFPIEIKKLQPHPTYIKQINDVSRKTGDYASLSLIDVKVLALTLQLEVEANNGSTDHLNYNPQIAQTIGNGVSGSQNTFNLINEQNSNSNEDDNLVSDISQNIEDEGVDLSETQNNINELQNNDDHHYFETVEDNEFEENELEDYNFHDCNEEIIGEKEKQEDENSSDEEVDEDNEEDDDDEGWITPSNIHKIKEKNDAEAGFKEPENIHVACMTSDFAMQNVLKHMKLQVMGPDGKLIHQLRTYILRCFTCRTTTSVMSKLFCSKCGNKTLKRVSVTVNPDGSQKLWINTRRAINTKGFRYPLPTFKGGKHSAYPLVVEDQRMPDQRPTKKGLKKISPLDPDYDAGDSPFSTTDIYSKAGQLGLVGKNQQGFHYWDRKNPNAPVKGKRRKK